MWETTFPLTGSADGGRISNGDAHRFSGDQQAGIRTQQHRREGLDAQQDGKLKRIDGSA